MLFDGNTTYNRDCRSLFSSYFFCGCNSVSIRLRASYLCRTQGARCPPSRCFQLFRQEQISSPHTSPKGFIQVLAQLYSCTRRLHLVHFPAQYKLQTLKWKKCRGGFAEKKTSANQKQNQSSSP